MRHTDKEKKKQRRTDRKAEMRTDTDSSLTHIFLPQTAKNLIQAVGETINSCYIACSSSTMRRRKSVKSNAPTASDPLMQVGRWRLILLRGRLIDGVWFDARVDVF